MESDNKLNPCPFCGCNSTEINESDLCVECKLCGARGPICYNDDFTGSWNTRRNGENGQYAFCPFTKDNKCRISQCMIWNEGKSRCGLVNTVYINSTVCGE